MVLKRVCHWEEEGKEGRAPPHRLAHSKVDLCEPFRTDLLSELQGLPWAISLPVKVPSSGCFEGTGGKEANGMKIQETEQRNLSEITQEPETKWEQEFSIPYTSASIPAPCKSHKLSALP